MASDRHHRYEALAVGHVLGGLSQHDAAEFRSHLIGCRPCRLQVAELRDLAADLSQAEREERQRTATMLETAEATDDPPRPPPWRRPELRIVAGLVAVMVVLAVLFWNFHLRRVSASLEALAEARADVIRVVAEGEPAALELATGVSAIVASDATLVAVVASGLPSAMPGEVLVVWRLDGDGAVLDQDAIPVGAYRDGRLALTVAAEDGAEDVVEVLVTVETIPRSAGIPAGRVLVRATL